jgi:hypothetical protein
LSNSSKDNRPTNKQFTSNFPLLNSVSISLKTYAYFIVIAEKLVCVFNPPLPQEAA